ncbi:hypothetical protein BRDCF_p2054 [Bacteroidales bacterium CF]|nr:hypothetical protein BRDCF_p2054 [Bacteroidales bacterium CF]
MPIFIFSLKNQGLFDFMSATAPASFFLQSIGLIRHPFTDIE